MGVTSRPNGAADSSPGRKPWVRRSESPKPQRGDRTISVSPRWGSGWLVTQPRADALGYYPTPRWGEDTKQFPRFPNMSAATLNAPSMNAPSDKDPFNNNCYGTLVDRDYKKVGLPVLDVNDFNERIIRGYEEG